MTKATAFCFAKKGDIDGRPVQDINGRRVPENNAMMLDKVRTVLIAVFSVLSVLACLGICMSLAWLIDGCLRVVTYDGTRYPCRATVHVTSIQYDGSDCPVVMGVYAVGSKRYHAHGRPCIDIDVEHTFDIEYDPLHPTKYITLAEVNFRNMGYAYLRWSLGAFLAVLVVSVCAWCCVMCVNAVEDAIERR